MYGTTAWACRRGVRRGSRGFGAVPQRGLVTAGVRFRTFAVDATLPWALLRVVVGMPSGSFPAFAGHVGIAEYIISRRYVCCRSLHPQALGEIFGVDGKAEGNDVVLGLVRGRGSEHARGQMVSIAARSWLDPVGLRKGDSQGRSHGVCPLPTAGSGACSLWLFSGHRQQGNTSVVQRYMSTKFSLCIVLMELSSQLAKRGLHLGLGWLPREANQPADVLTNSDFSEFSPEKRIEVQWTDLKFKVLDRL